MITSMKITNFNIYEFQIHKTEEFDKSTAVCAKFQYLLMFYLLHVFDKNMKNSSNFNLEKLKDCIKLIREYQKLHKKFMLKRESSENKEFYDEILRNHPNQILDESLWG